MAKDSDESKPTGRNLRTDEIGGSREMGESSKSLGAWRALVLTEVERLERELAETPMQPEQAAEAESVRQNIDRAREATYPGKRLVERFRNWYSGTRIE